ncbi:MGH1-like glycoside hydrolase domain-containing protein [Actinacidiphila alni]|uniref:MGH1-like glycoside hydrolase domain-containing protein n=1 Tax=Actinacidiphila alni TaxID=380248 RepID=UPI0034521A41
MTGPGAARDAAEERGEAGGYAGADFDFDLRRSVAETLWTGSGWSTAALAPGTVCGVGACYAPPHAAPQARLSVAFEAGGVRIEDNGTPGIAGGGLLLAGGVWRLDGIERHGTYHRRDAGGRLVSLSVRSTLTPLYGQPGYALLIRVRNRGDHPLDVRVLPELTSGPVGRVPLGDWGWMPPLPELTGRTRAELVHEGLELRIDPGGEGEYALAVRIGDGVRGGSPREWARASRERTAARTAKALARVPRLITDVPGLDAYYRRSLASGLVCLWDNPAFATSPFVATSGIDGGALCAYAWDTGGYAPHTLALMLGGAVGDVLETMVKADLTDHYAIAPDGTGTGVAYAYSGWSLVMLAHAAACHDGLSPGLLARLHETEYRLADRFPAAGELRDYGSQHNLLEMRGSGWEHVVASPNAERAWSLDLLAELAEATGAALPVAELRARAGRILRAVRTELWDARAGWFRSRYPDGHGELAYSVQAFDALRAGACTPEMAAALLSHLREGAFLGPYGVSSVSAEDGPHYELGDVDWSGGGAYTGEAPQLALTLWERGEDRTAWDVLSRVLWLGAHFPYYPQDHYCDRPAAPPRGRRANVIAGLTGAEAVLTGLAGLRPRPDGALDWAPPAWLPGAVELRGLRYRGHEIDLRLADGRAAAAVDGRTHRAGTSGPVRILEAPDG